MKYIFLLLPFIYFTSKGQNVTPSGAANQIIYNRGGMSADSLLAIPLFSDTSAANSYAPLYRKGGKIIVSGSKFWYNDGNVWVNAHQFSDTQAARLRGLVYEPYSLAFYYTMLTGNHERGATNTYMLNVVLKENDDLSDSMAIVSLIDLTDSLGVDTIRVGGLSTAINVSHRLALVYYRDSDRLTDTTSLTYPTYLPQWYGSSTDTTFSTYSGISSKLTKVVQASASITAAFSPSNEYVWFVSNKNNAVIRDGNDFVQSIGSWGDASTEFWAKSLTMTLANGSTSGTVYLYRTRLTKNLSSFTYKIQ